MSITFKELLMGIPLSEIPINHQQNAEILLKKINIIRQAYGKPMIPTSVYRTEQKHRDIYRAKGITDNSKIPWGSQHLQFLAIDVYDPTGELHAFLKAHPEVLEEADMYCEERQGNWQHLQCKPFKSFNPGDDRWFQP